MSYSRAAHQRPTIFITHANVDGLHIARLAEVFRRAQIEALTVNADHDPAGKLLVDSIERHSSPTKILLVAASPSALERDWFRTGPLSKTLEKLTDELDQVVVLDLVARSRRVTLPPYLKGYTLVDLSDYASGMNSLLELVGSADRAPADKPPAAGDEEYYTVSGAFEVGRPSSGMFSELKRQLFEYPYKIDLKYLYWDVRAASRWQDITQRSRYLTTQIAVNVLTRHADDLAEQVLGDAGAAEVSVINFGVGTGQKDYLILKALLDVA
jgi:hypothetical protein